MNLVSTQLGPSLSRRLRPALPTALALILVGPPAALGKAPSPSPSPPPPPTFLIWTLPGRPIGGISLGPRLLHLSVGLATWQELLGPPATREVDGWGLKHLGWPRLGLEAATAEDGRLLSLRFLLQAQGRGAWNWAAADLSTDRGLVPGMRMAQIRATQGSPARVRPATEGRGVVWVYPLARGTEMEVAFGRDDPKEKASSLTLY